MSAHPLHHAPGTAGHAHGHGSPRGYRIGAALAIVLTIIPFWLVMSGTLHNPALTAGVIFALGFVQIVVHYMA